MKSECENEINGPAAAYASINKVRERAGIPNVEVVWADAVLCKHPGKHTSKEGMREIIAQERKIEFAFEGHIFWDMIRTRKAVEEFNSPAMGWDKNVSAADSRDFFKLKLIQPRMFTLRDCLWPLPTSELNKNKQLIQNPGW
jgi:hypothetical protein